MIEPDDPKVLDYYPRYIDKKSGEVQHISNTRNEDTITQSSEEEGNSKRVVEEGTHSSPNEDENGFSEEEIMRMIVNM